MAHRSRWSPPLGPGHGPGLRPAFSAARSAPHGRNQAPSARDLLHPKGATSAGREPLRHLRVPPARPPLSTNLHSLALAGPRVPPCQNFVRKRPKSFGQTVARVRDGLTWKLPLIHQSLGTVLADKRSRWAPPPAHANSGQGGKAAHRSCGGIVHFVLAGDLTRLTFCWLD